MRTLLLSSMLAALWVSSARELRAQSPSEPSAPGPQALLTAETFTPSLTREPQYVGEPRYFVVVLEGGHQVWGVLAGSKFGTEEVLYLDANGNGDLTDEGERAEPGQSAILGRREGFIQNLGLVASPRVALAGVEVPGRDTPVQLSVFRHNARLWVVVRDGNVWWYTYHIDSANPIQPGPTPEEALVFHLGGPMAFRTSRPFQAEAGGETELYAQLVTLPCPLSDTYATVYYSYLPADVVPTGTVRYETRSGETITQDIALPRRC